MEAPAQDRAVDPAGQPVDTLPVPWTVYVLVAAAGDRTYVGVTTDLERRLAQHNGERPGGAKATRAGRPWRLGAAFGPYDGRGDAQRVERALKRRRGAARLRPPDDL